MTMNGRKLSTLPTPPNTPSMTSECTTGLTPAAVSRRSTAPESIEMPVSSHPESTAPTTLKVR